MVFMVQETLWARAQDSQELEPPDSRVRNSYFYHFKYAGRSSCFEYFIKENSQQHKYTRTHAYTHTHTHIHQHTHTHTHTLAKWWHLDECCRCTMCMHRTLPCSRSGCQDFARGFLVPGPLGVMVPWHESQCLVCQVCDFFLLCVCWGSGDKKCCLAPIDVRACLWSQDLSFPSICPDTGKDTLFEWVCTCTNTHTHTHPLLSTMPPAQGLITEWTEAEATRLEDGWCSWCFEETTQGLWPLYPLSRIPSATWIYQIHVPIESTNFIQHAKQIQLFGAVFLCLFATYIRSTLVISFFLPQPHAHAREREWASAREWESEQARARSFPCSLSFAQSLSLALSLGPSLALFPLLSLHFTCACARFLVHFSSPTYLSQHLPRLPYSVSC